MYLKSDKASHTSQIILGVVVPLGVVKYSWNLPVRIKLCWFSLL